MPFTLDGLCTYDAYLATYCSIILACIDLRLLPAVVKL